MSEQDALFQAALAMLRTQLNAIDEQLLALVAQRAALVAQVDALKTAHGVPFRDYAREQQLVDTLVAAARERYGSALRENDVRTLMHTVLAACRPLSI
jgi:chorismate mutase